MKQSGADFTFSSAPLAKVRKVEFGLMNHEQIVFDNYEINSENGRVT